MPVVNANSVVYTICQCPIYETLGTNGLRQINAIKMVVRNNRYIEKLGPIVQN